MLVLRALDLIAASLCAIMIFRRYTRREFAIVPGDVLLWTLTLFFVLPLAYSALGPLPEFRIYPAFNRTRIDPLARGIGAVSTSFAIAMTIYSIRQAERVEAGRHFQSINVQKRRYWLMLSFLPLGVVALAPNTGDYRTFAASFVLRQTGQAFTDRTSAASQYSVLVTWSTYVSCIAFAIWFATGRKSKLSLIAGAMVLGMNFWLNGKRNIVAMFILILVFAVASETAPEGRKFGKIVGVGIVSIGFVVGISIWYQTTYRPFLATSGDRTETFVVDYGRLDVLYMAISGQTGGDIRRPLAYPLQNVEDYAKILMPGLESKDSITYTDRVTSISLDQPIQERAGSITTSLISESVDSIGVLGLILGPLILTGVTRVASFRKDRLLRIAGALLASTLAVVHLLATVPILLVVVTRLTWLLLRKPTALTGNPVGVDWPARLGQDEAPRVR